MPIRSSSWVTGRCRMWCSSIVAQASSAGASMAIDQGKVVIATLIVGMCLSVRKLSMIRFSPPRPDLDELPEVGPGQYRGFSAETGRYLPARARMLYLCGFARKVRAADDAAVPSRRNRGV